MAVAELSGCRVSIGSGVPVTVGVSVGKRVFVEDGRGVAVNVDCAVGATVVSATAAETSICAAWLEQALSISATRRMPHKTITSLPLRLRCPSQSGNMDNHKKNHRRRLTNKRMERPHTGWMDDRMMCTLLIAENCQSFALANPVSKFTELLDVHI